MSTRDLLLVDLYNTPRDEQVHELAARSAPLLYFDAREPFLPLAAGYTLFTNDGPSPSFDRMIELRPEDKPAAARAIEYAIWWDWDIHHLYEVEHVWVYLDAQDRTVRVEGSWHGKFYDIPLKLEDGHPVLLSEPGKHAFAPDPSWFHQRAHDYRREDTLSVGLHAHVLINSMFSGKIRSRAFDRVLVRSFLIRQAFTPSWSFTQAFNFQASKLVPWPALKQWIPERVNTVLARLESTTRPSNYRALHLASTAGDLAGLESAAHAGVDAVTAPLRLRENRLALGDGNLLHPLDLDEALDFCLHEPMGAYLELMDPDAVDRLAWFVRTNDLSENVVVMSPDTHLLAHYDAFVPDGVGAVQLTHLDQDPLEAATESGALFVNPRWESLPGAREYLAPEWIRRVHKAGLGIISWPVSDTAEMEDLERMGVDIVWQN